MCPNLLLLSIIRYGSSCSHIPSHKVVTSLPTQGAIFQLLLYSPKTLNYYHNLSHFRSSAMTILLLWSILTFVGYLKGVTSSFAPPLSHILIKLFIFTLFGKPQVLVNRFYLIMCRPTVIFCLFNCNTICCLGNFPFVCSIKIRLSPSLTWTMFSSARGMTASYSMSYW